MNEFEKAIKRHLDGMAMRDQVFSAKYADSSKSIEDCCRYVISEVRKTKREAFTDEEIFGMAIHYYDEKSVVAPKSVPSCRVVVSGQDKKQSSVKEVKKGRTRRKVEAERSEEGYVQGLLFGCGEVEA